MGHCRRPSKAFDESHLSRVHADLVVVGYVLLEPAFYPGRTILGYSKSNIAWTLLGGLLNTLGAWALFAALKCGGKASVVVPLTALYPLPAILLVPLIFHESITLLQVIGILCSLVAVVLLSSESEGTEATRDSVFAEPLR